MGFRAVWASAGTLPGLFSASLRFLAILGGNFSNRGYAVSRLFFTFCALLFAASCGRGPETRTLIDAAALYSENRAVFESIRAAYPGPFADFARVPARDPADENEMDRDFLNHVRGQIPVDFIDFYPIGDTAGDWGGDEIDVVIRRYGTGDNWITLSLVYFSVPLTLSDENPSVRLFDACDETALGWLESRSRSEGRTAFCRINPNWYAHQRVE